MEGFKIYTFDEYKSVLGTDHEYSRKSKEMFFRYFSEYLAKNEDANFYVRKDHNDRDEIFLIMKDSLIKASIYKDDSFQVVKVKSDIVKTIFTEGPNETILEILFENEKSLMLHSTIDSHGRHREEYALAIKELSYKLM